MRLALGLLLIGSLVANSYAAAAALEGLPLDGHTRQGVPVVRVSYADSKRGKVNTQYDGTTDLDHYRDFVNDPYVNTENLGQILSTRQRPELRSGRPSNPDDDIWQNRRQRGQNQGHVQAHANQQASSATWGRVPDPWNRRSNSQNVRSATTQDSDALAQHRQQLERQRQQQAAQYRHHQYYEGGDENWEVASRGEDHVTYRRRNPHRAYDRLVEAPAPQQYYRTRQSSGQGEGKVLARVVDLRSGDETLVRDNSRRNWNRQPELRSLDQSQMVREGDWVQSEKTDNHVTWRRVGTTGSGSGWTSSSGHNAHESWRRNMQGSGNWVEASRSENHVTYRRDDSGHNDYVTARPTYRPTTQRPTTRRPAMELRTLDYNQRGWRGQHREGDWIQVEKTLNQMTWARAGSERTRGWHSGGLTYDTWWKSSDNDGTWVEVARSDDHVTYRKIGSGLSDYKPTRQTPELRSLDNSHSGQYREGGWVRTSESDNHVTWRRVGSRQLGPVTASRDHYRDHEVVLRRDHYVPTTPTQRPIHYYPIMNDQATAEKVRSGGPNVMIG